MSFPLNKHQLLLHVTLFFLIIVAVGGYSCQFDYRDHTHQYNLETTTQLGSIGK